MLLWTNSRVVEWLRLIDLAEYAPNLRGNGVHGALMVSISNRQTGSSQTDRQADRQIDRQADTDRQRDKQTNKQIQKSKQTN